MRSYVPEDAQLVPPEATRVFQGIIFDVYQWQQQLFDGSTTTFERLKRPDSVEIIAIKDEKIVILEQEQPGSGLFYSLPGGRHDVASEDELAAAQRELREETGMTFADWKLVAVQQPFVKIEWFVYTFLATSLVSESAPRLDAGERITASLKTLQEVQSLSRDPKARNLGQEIFDRVDSLDALVALPDISKRIG